MYLFCSSNLKIVLSCVSVNRLISETLVFGFPSQLKRLLYIKYKLKSLIL